MIEPAYRIVEPLSVKGGGRCFTAVPDRPGRVSNGGSVEDALVDGQDSIRCWIEGADELGRAVSQLAPRSRLQGD